MLHRDHTETQAARGSEKAAILPTASSQAQFGTTVHSNFIYTIVLVYQ